MRMLLLTLAGVLSMLTGLAVAAPVFEDARGLLEYAYGPYVEGRLPADQDELLTPSLRALLEAERQDVAAGALPALDFDPFVNGQDFELDALVVSDPMVDGDAATVIVAFTNFGVGQQLRFSLLRRTEGWKIDDIESLNDGEGWRLSTLLAADPLLN